MNYTEVRISTSDNRIIEELIAILSSYDVIGFEEQEDGLLAYISEGELKQLDLRSILSSYNVAWTTRHIEEQNWNAVWEGNFQPVIVSGFCTVKADFHDIEVDTPYQIVITPKMSFGTGHHATTQLMMTMMRDISFDNCEVLDFGTGTGILAILAEKLGASTVLAIDNDQWSYENALENVARNNSSKIIVKNGSLDVVNYHGFDIILANINRHILLEYMRSMYDHLKVAGILLISGLLTDDRDMILSAALDAGFRLNSENNSGNWIALSFKKV